MEMQIKLPNGEAVAIEVIELRSLKKGDYFHKVNAKKGTIAKKWYIKGYWEISERKFNCDDTDDMCRDVWLKPTTLVTMEDLSDIIAEL